MSTKIETFGLKKFVIFSSTDLVHLRRLLFAMIFAGFLGIMAQVKFYLPETPVPVTAQVFGALIAGILLGSKTGTLSVLIYVALGFNGVPWFSKGVAGVDIITIGYLIGFIFAAFIIGYVFDKIRKQKSFVLVKIISLMITGIAIIYMCGAAWIFVITGAKLGLAELAAIAWIPFIPGEMIKLVAAVSIARILK